MRISLAFEIHLSLQAYVTAAVEARFWGPPPPKTQELLPREFLLSVKGG